jgi:hypothetical protein
MENSLIKSPMQYLDRATGTLRDLGITPTRPDFTPITRCFRSAMIPR